ADAALAEHFAGGSDRPAGAVGEELNLEERHRERVADVVEGPGGAAVGGDRDPAVEAGRGAGLRVDEVDAAEGREAERIDDLAADEGLLLLLPRRTAVGRLQDLPELSDDPARLVVDERDVVERRRLRDRLLLGRHAASALLGRLVLGRLPGRAAVLALDDRRLVTDRDHV